MREKTRGGDSGSSPLRLTFPLGLSHGLPVPPPPPLIPFECSVRDDNLLLNVNINS